MQNTTLPTPSSKIIDALRSLGFTDAAEWAIAGSAGSGRGYYRVHEGKHYAILQVSASTDDDFKRFASFGKTFASFNLPTPRISAVDEEAHQILMKDLGPNMLISEILPLNPISGNVRILYSEVINSLIRWQEASPAVFMSRPDIAARKFDFAALKWETDYFRDNYLVARQGINNIPLSVENFFSTLACTVDTHPKVLMHRDFQSQNIMVRPNTEIGFVDFQGARRGSMFYDIASLLWDPYVNLPLDLVQDFFEYWHTGFKMCEECFSKEEAWVLFLQASLQRVMQAMGAFCFLSREKKMENFEQYIEPGKARLSEILSLYKAVSPEKSHEAIDFLISTLTK
ncbi:MAG: phosphotransferase [Fibrobacteraceae bacterium]|nr:MAG: aminoglycoside phosphotransferase [Fibrobacteres bacterium CG2_30_45_31]